MWNWLFGKKKGGQPAPQQLSKSSGPHVTAVSSLARTEDCLEIRLDKCLVDTSEGCCPSCPGIEDSEILKRKKDVECCPSCPGIEDGETLKRKKDEGCSPCCPGIEDSATLKRRKQAPRLGLDRRGRPVTPHTCSLDTEPAPSASTAYRMKSATSVSSTVPARRPTVHHHKCEHGASSTDPTGPQFAQFKSPTVPKYRPTVTPHHCLDDDGEDVADKVPTGDKAGGNFWKWFLFALLLIGVAGAAAGPSLLAAAKKRCLDCVPQPKECVPKPKPC